jgi:hypothetical protein
MCTQLNELTSAKLNKPLPYGTIEMMLKPEYVLQQVMGTETRIYQSRSIFYQH